MDKYSWSQTVDDVTVTIPIAASIRGKNIDCRIEPNHLYICIRGESEPILNVSISQNIECRERHSNELKWIIPCGQLMEKDLRDAYVLILIKMKEPIGGHMLSRANLPLMFLKLILLLLT